MQYSFSKLTHFYDCPYSFYRNYIKEEKGINNLFAEYGILVHSILERYAKGELKKEFLVEEFKAGFELRINEPLLMFGRDLTQSYFDKGVKFFSNFDGFWGLEPLQSEYKFETPLNNEDTFEGIIDLILRDDEGNIIIVDHKSHSKFAKKELKTKARQLYLYSKAVYDKFSKFPSELWFNHFKDGYLEKIFFQKADYDEAIQWALETIENIKACMGFEPNVNDKFFCNYLCNYRENCDYKN